MAYRLESKAEAAARIRREFADYGPGTLLTEQEAGPATGFSHFTLKHWRRHTPEKGPKPVFLHGKVFYSAGELRRWLAATQAESAAWVMRPSVNRNQDDIKTRGCTGMRGVGATRPGGHHGAPNVTKASRGTPLPEVRTRGNGRIKRRPQHRLVTRLPPSWQATGPPSSEAPPWPTTPIPRR